MVFHIYNFFLWRSFSLDLLLVTSRSIYPELILIRYIFLYSAPHGILFCYFPIYFFILYFICAFDPNYSPPAPDFVGLLVYFYDGACFLSIESHAPHKCFRMLFLILLWAQLLPFCLGLSRGPS
jgi:hypothetical protein